MSSDFIVTDTLITTDQARLEHVPAKDVWTVEIHAADRPFIYFDRAQATALHAWLGEQLGLGWNGNRPGPRTAPLTASKAHEGGAKASRNAVTVEKPDTSGGADRPVSSDPFAWDVVARAGFSLAGTDTDPEQ